MRLKQQIRTLFSALLLAGVAGGLLPLKAQEPGGGMPPLPIDSAVRIGKLPNGLTYFIRHNAEPKERAEFYIVQRVGSMQEEDSQQGLAHFLEHIAFNGTKNFPGKGIDHFLESIGASFGRNINAYTSFDETVYTLMNIPVPRKSVVDSCVLILHDWSNFISLEDKEIDLERGVIEEEWRSRDNGDMRNMTKMLELAFPNNKYGQRMPIGKMEIVRNFPYQVLRDYYKKWYRPDQQALVIVGDVDVDYTEAQIKKIFADIPAPVNPAERVYTEVPDNETPIVGIAADPEATQNSINICFKQDVTPLYVRATLLGPVEDYTKGVIAQMANQRFSDLVKKPNAPFTSASMDMGDFIVAKTKDAVNFDASFKEGAWEPALKALTAEIVRIRKYGFNKSEYDRAKKDFLVSIKNLYNERDKRKNDAWANEYVQYFINGGYLMDIASYYQLMNGVVEEITVEQINAALTELIPEKNVVVLMTSVEKPEVKLPSTSQLEAQFLSGMKQEVTPLKEEVSNQKLIDKLPMKGRIVKEEKNGKFGSTVWTLSNGTKVILKKTDYKDDEILLTGTRPGGSFNFSKPATLDLKVLNMVSDLGGLGKFDDSALEKALAGRIASAGLSVSELTDDVSGSTTKEDLETMLQLLYLNFTARRSDKEAFKAWQERMIAKLEADKANPLSTLMDSVPRFLYPNNPENYPLTESEVKAINYDRVLQLFRSRFANARGFQFVFVGNIDEAKLRPLVERYIASLPATKVTYKSFTDRVVRAIPGTHTKAYSQAMTTPTGIAVDILSTAGEYTHKELLVAATLQSILDQLYTKTIREDEGGTYGVGVRVNVSRYPTVHRSLTVQFQTDPTKVETLNKLVFKGLEDMIKQGPSEEYFTKAIANLGKEHAESLRKNNYWLNQLERYYTHGFDFVTDYEAQLKSIKTDDVKALVKSLYDSRDRIVITFQSTTAEAKK